MNITVALTEQQWVISVRQQLHDPFTLSPRSHVIELRPHTQFGAFLHEDNKSYYSLMSDVIIIIINSSKPRLFK